MEISQSLDSALGKLKTARQDPYVLVAAARNVTSIADDAELTAWETSDHESRTKLLRKVQDARMAADSARQTARNYSLTATRESLLGNMRSDGKYGDDTSTVNKKESNNGFPSASRSHLNRVGDEPISDTARLARDINDTLRRTTAVVAEEVARSRAAGDVVEDSSRRLARTRDQHVTLGASLRQGSKTLHRLRTSETLANAVVIVSFAIFFITAGYVISRRLRSSLVVSVVVRPATSAVLYPFALVYRGTMRLSKMNYVIRSWHKRNATAKTAQFSSSLSSIESSTQDDGAQAGSKDALNIGIPVNLKLTIKPTVSATPISTNVDDINYMVTQVDTTSPKLTNEVSVPQTKPEVFQQDFRHEAGLVKEQLNVQESIDSAGHAPTTSTLERKLKSQQKNDQNSETGGAEEL